MKNTIFDLVEADIPEGKKGFFEVASRAPEPKDDSYFNTIKDYGKTILKGSIEGLSRLGTMMGPLQNKQGKSSAQELEEQTETLNEFLPTEENYAQKSIRRGLRQAPSVIANPFGGPVQAGVRSFLAGGAGQAVENLGGGEGLQTAAELTAFIGPDITKKLLSQGKEKEIINFAKKMGMSDEEITPLIQSEFKQKWLAKLAPKKGATEKALKQTKNALDESYGKLSKSEFAVKEISEVENGKLINSLYEKLNDMPREIRGKIEADLGDLLNNKITGKSLINFYADTNSHLGGNTKQLSLLKEPIKDALRSISQELSQDFEMMNKLYTKYYPMASRLKPNLTSDLVRAAEVISGMGALGFLTVGYYPPLIGILGEQGAKKLAQQILINPRFQQLSSKMVNALNQNNLPVSMKLIKSFKNQVEGFSPELSEELGKISEEDIIELFRKKQEDKSEK